MCKEVKPNVLIVDDETDTLKFSLEAGMNGCAATKALHPNDVEVDDLEWADVVLVDQRLEKWPERDALEVPGLQPKSGVALAAIYREHVDALEATNPTAIAVHSARLTDLSGRLPIGSAAHIIARMNNLEWAFDKSDKELQAKVACLGSAVKMIPKTWPSSEDNAAVSLAVSLLGLEEKKNWSARSWDDVVHCQIPIVDLMGGAHGLLFVRWLLQTIIPFPTFLWDKNWLAARLRITPESLRQVREGESELSNRLEEASYGGLLAGFDGERWWKGAIEQFVWEIRKEGAREAADFHAALVKMAGCDLEQIDATSPAVCVGPDLRPTGVITKLENAVRLVSDLWPPFADDPLAEIKVVAENPGLEAIVHPLDTDAFSDAASDGVGGEDGEG